jgi:hypothetical protein
LDDSKGESGLEPNDIRQVEPGIIHPYVTCDDCSNTVSPFPCVFHRDALILYGYIIGY